MRLYSCKAIASLIERYTNSGGAFFQMREGVLGYGDLLCYGEGLKTIVIREVALNEWNSAHTIRMYHRLPKKYQALLEKENLL